VQIYWSSPLKLAVYYALFFLIFAFFISAQPALADDVTATEIGFVKTKPQEGFSVATDRGYMTSYTVQIPGTEVTFEMVPIPGGEFLLGSPDGEAERRDDEGPQVRVKVAPFWMSKCEITWAEYHAYMAMYDAFKQFGDLRNDAEETKSLAAVKTYLEQESLEVDGVTAPTPLYDPDTAYEAGEDPDQPAVTMTQFAARQYTKWLSGITGKAYRLPTEAEWEYAARAGSTTAYSFGDDAASLAEFAWYAKNADDQTHAVGSKPANAWGLHDMHGNAAEWVLDEYAAEHYSTLKGASIDGAVATLWPKQLYPRVYRGGSWLDGPDVCRSASRQPSDDSEWSLSDPNLPVSPWWFTEEPSTGIGFRIIRPLDPPDEKMQKKIWEADVEDLQFDVAERLEEGRGTQSSADQRLPAAIEELRSAGLVE